MDQTARQLKESTKRWIKGIPYEVAFWRSYYGNRRSRTELFSWSLYNKECELDDFDVAAFIGTLGDDPVILDVGCALSYAFGNRFNGELKPVTYVDPLAPFYNRILDRYHIDRPRIRFGMVENLSSNFEENTVDFIHIRNALDHCADPLEGILQALCCLKTGGILYLNHFRNEAVNEGYRGFHQFNVDEHDGHTILWNRDTRVDVTETIAPFAKTTTTVAANGRIVSVITKTAPVPKNAADPRQTGLRTANMLMTTAELFHSPRFAFGYQMSVLFTTITHRTVRLLPHSLVNRLKKLLSHN